MLYICVLHVYVVTKYCIYNFNCKEYLSVMYCLETCSNNLQIVYTSYPLFWWKCCWQSILKKLAEDNLDLLSVFNKSNDIICTYVEPFTPDILNYCSVAVESTQKLLWRVWRTFQVSQICIKLAQVYQYSYFESP